MYGRVDWLGEHLVECSNANGQKITIDWENGPTPVQLTLQMMGACALADVVEGLKQRDFDKVWIEMESERADSAPKVFTSIHMVYHIRGEVPRKLVERIVGRFVHSILHCLILGHRTEEESLLTHLPHLQLPLLLGKQSLLPL